MGEIGARAPRVGFAFDVLVALGQNKRDEGSRIVENEVARRLAVRSRTPRMSGSPRASSSAIVSALVMPRSATTLARDMEKR